MANNEKIISQSVFEQAVKDILIELVNSTYSWESYSDEEVGQLVELDPTQVAELTAVICDSVSAKNKVYSSQYTKELLQENLIEANKYTDDLVANLSNIKLDIVDSLPDSSNVDKSTIYILKDSSGGTNNSLNVWSDSTSAFVEVGKLSVDFTNYYTKSEVDAELAKKANADEVLKPDAIVADLTTTSGSTTLSTAGLQTELDKKANDDEVVKTTDITTTINSTSTDTQVPSAKAVYDGAIKNKNMKSYTRVEQLGLSYPCTVQDIWMALPHRSTISVLNELSTDYITDCPANYGILTIEKVSEGRYRILYSQSNGSSVNITAGIWQGQLKGTDGSGLIWTPINNFATTTIIDGTTTDCFTLKPGIYSVANGCSKTMNFPYDDNTNYSGTVMVFGSYNIPDQNKGYRRMIYMDNKQRMAVASEWWGIFSGGWKHVGKSKVEDVPKTQIIAEDADITVNQNSVYTVFNGVCYVTMWGFKVNTVGQHVINRTLPRPKTTMQGTCYYGTEGQVGGCIFIFDEGAAGKLFAETHVAGETLYGSFSYPVAE